MNSTDIIGIWNVVAQFVVALAAIAAVIVALIIGNRQIKENRKQQREQIEASNNQLTKQIEESRRLATEERQYQSRPIIAPKKEIYQTTAVTVDMNTGQIEGERFHNSDHTINWAYNHAIRISLQNMGNGPAFNLHAALYGSENTNYDQFVSWDSGPVEAEGPLDIELEHSMELRLLHDESVDGKHPLYDRSLNSLERPWTYRIACLTLTYHDLLGKKYVSIYNYTVEHRWIHVATEEIPGQPPLDLKELNDRKKQGPKLSAPSARVRS